MKQYYMKIQALKCVCKITADRPVVYHVVKISLRARRKSQIVWFWSVLMFAVIFAGVKQLGCDSDNLPQSRANFKNA
jgi:hypothetical protein